MRGALSKAGATWSSWSMLVISMPRGAQVSSTQPGRRAQDRPDVLVGAGPPREVCLRRLVHEPDRAAEISYVRGSNPACIIRYLLCVTVGQTAGRTVKEGVGNPGGIGLRVIRVPPLHALRASRA